MGGKKVTKEIFLERCKNHPEYYNIDYSLVIWVKINQKIKLRCNLCHRIWESLPYNHLRGQGCACRSGQRIGDALRLGREGFVKKSKKVREDFCNFNYDKVIYVDAFTKVEIGCNKCGKYFWQCPDVHYLGTACSNCPRVNIARRITTDELLLRFKQSDKVADHLYDYRLVDCKGVDSYIKIICLACDRDFLQTPNNHLAGKGCSKCRRSFMENKAAIFFKSNEINFEEQKTFIDCKRKGKLKFDFWLPNRKVLIELHGRQHIEPVTHFGGEATFKDQLERDFIKTNYAIQNNIDLEIIFFNDDLEYELNRIKQTYT